MLTNTAVHQPAGATAPTLIRTARARGLLRTTTVRTPAFVRGTTAMSSPRPPRDVRDAFAAPYRTADRRHAVEAFVADIPLEPDHVSAGTLDALAADVGTLDVPVLLAWGPRDPVFSDLYLRDLLQRLPHADVHRYEGASHLVTEDAPACLDDVRAWVSQLDVAGEAASEPGPSDTSPPVTSGASAGTGPRRPLWAGLEARGGDPATALAELGRTPRAVSFARLWAVVRDLAAGLVAAGVRPGDRVALLVPPGADLTAVVYACWRAGAVIVAADAGLGPRGLARALRGAWPDHVVATPRGLAAAQRPAHPGAPHRRHRPADRPAAGSRHHAGRRRPSRPRPATAGRAGARRRGRGGVHLRRHRPGQGRGVPAPAGRGAA